ncbi:orotidine 5'-phosphate decarboxylase [Alicyclobacillus contaminans]|uniref:orotidine-5'-phosphate decarboxylase n=1 Tax=Alicyclobacillus contaminans TaxID=392016 RepID=UPI0004147392|nr:orotidine-5'-phosphate decarboxylase [Alicyclobacillus contaminans]GMA49132.1 orotidine 5'-phosphate decarboxylase [Alicyclobacillus contaminans]
MTISDAGLRDLLGGPDYAFARAHSYIALDVASEPQALALVDAFGEAVNGYKVGLELFHSAGIAMVERLVRMGKRVFLDVKLHDIPNTVAGALRALADTGIELVNVHAVGGVRMMTAAREALPPAAGRPKLIAVTVLTSLGEAELRNLGLPEAAEWVPRLAKLVYQCGLDGVVASALEVPGIYAELPAHFLTVVPGIRPPGAAVHDQVRSVTPGEAIAAGASHLVIGRAVTRSDQPLQALQRIWDDMERAHRSAVREKGE